LVELCFHLIDTLSNNDNDNFNFWGVGCSGDYAIVRADGENEDVAGLDRASIAGSAYIFKTLDGGASWEQAQKIVASDRAGGDEF
jgi:hypothetical protein